MKNKKVLYFVTNKSAFSPNYISIGEKALEEGARVFVICHQDLDETTYKKCGFRVFTYAKYSILNVIRLYKIISPDIAHHIGLHSMIYGTIAAKITKVPMVINHILGRIGVPGNFLFKAVMKFFAKAQNFRFIVENKEDKEILEKSSFIHTDKNIHICHGTGIDVEEIKEMSHPRGQAGITFGFADLIRWDRGLGEFIKAIDIVRKDEKAIPNFIVKGFADSFEMGNIPLKTIRNWADDGLINWWGFVRDPLKIWTKAHVGVFPSYRNGLSVSIARAACCGRALIVTDAPGNNIFFKHEENALLTEPGNPQSLAEAMIRLCNDDALRTKLSSAARMLAVEKFNRKELLGQYISIYDMGGN